jgi:hypothetical protein
MADYSIENSSRFQRGKEERGKDVLLDLET